MGLLESIANSKAMQQLFGQSFENYAKKAADSKPAMVGVKRYEVSPLANQQSIFKKSKPSTGIPFKVLRRFSEQHEITRAAVNSRCRQITSLEWDIVPVEEDDKTDRKKEVKELKEWFKNIGGRQNRYRKFMDKSIEDLLVLDALAIEKQKTLGGDLLKLIPVDATTIRLVVQDNGDLVEPPQPAYKQVINGQITAELTLDEMIYEMLNPRTSTPYGLAPLETLLLTVSASLQAANYNLDYLSEGNIPEGFFSVPDTWTPQMIKEFQDNWDAVLQGDTEATAKLHFVPGGQGSGYTPTKKMSDMAWKEFNMWLLHVTCAVFDISPREIGFEPDKGLGGSGFEEGQESLAQRRGIKPLLLFFQEIFDDLIQNDLGHPDLRFKYLGLDTKDEKREADVAKVEIESGQKTINETRRARGLEPIDDKAADKLMIVGGQPTFIDDETQEEKKKTAEMLASRLGGGKKPTEDEDVDDDEPKTDDKPKDGRPPTPPTKEEQDDTTKSAESRHLELIGELRRFRRMALRRMKNNRPQRPFESKVIPNDDLKDMNDRIAKAKDAESVHEVFDEFGRDYQTEFLNDAIQLKKAVKKVAGDDTEQATPA